MGPILSWPHSSCKRVANLCVEGLLYGRAVQASVVSADVRTLQRSFSFESLHISSVPMRVGLVLHPGHVETERELHAKT
jgi:hypothetical protein